MDFLTYLLTFIFFGLLIILLLLLLFITDYSHYCYYYPFFGAASRTVKIRPREKLYSIILPLVDLASVSSVALVGNRGFLYSPMTLID